MGREVSVLDYVRALFSNQKFIPYQRFIEILESTSLANCKGVEVFKLLKSLPVVTISYLDKSIQLIYLGNVSELEKDIEYLLTMFEILKPTFQKPRKLIDLFLQYVNNELKLSTANEFIDYVLSFAKENNFKIYKGESQGRNRKTPHTVLRFNSKDIGMKEFRELLTKIGCSFEKYKWHKYAIPSILLNEQVMIITSDDLRNKIFSKYPMYKTIVHCTPSYVSTTNRLAKGKAFLVTDEETVIAILVKKQ